MKLATEIKGRENQKYSFKVPRTEEIKALYLNEGLTDKEKEEKVVDLYDELSYTIQKPTMNHLIAGLGQINAGQTMNLAAGGRVIFNNCCIDCSDDITDNMLLTIYIELAKEHLLPADIELKKN